MRPSSVHGARRRFWICNGQSDLALAGVRWKDGIFDSNPSRGGSRTQKKKKTPAAMKATGVYTVLQRESETLLARRAFVTTQDFCWIDIPAQPIVCADDLGESPLDGRLCELLSGLRFLRSLEDRSAESEFSESHCGSFLLPFREGERPRENPRKWFTSPMQQESGGLSVFDSLRRTKHLPSRYEALAQQYNYRELGNATPMRPKLLMQTTRTSQIDVSHYRRWELNPHGVTPRGF